MGISDRAFLFTLASIQILSAKLIHLLDGSNPWTIYRRLKVGIDGGRQPFPRWQAGAELTRAHRVAQCISSHGLFKQVNGHHLTVAIAPADISIQVYSQGNIVSHQRGPLATLRRTLAQSAGAIMWSVRMIGVAIAFLAPWVIAIVVIVWIAKRIIRARRKL